MAFPNKWTEKQVWKYTARCHRHAATAATLAAVAVNTVPAFCLFHERILVLKQMHCMFVECCSTPYLQQQQFVWLIALCFWRWWCARLSWWATATSTVFDAAVYLLVLFLCYSCCCVCFRLSFSDLILFLSSVFEKTRYAFVLIRSTKILRDGSSIKPKNIVSHECRMQSQLECGIMLTAMNSGRGWHSIVLR